MSTVAEEAGVTRIILYRHFESKEALYHAVLTTVTERLRNDFALTTPAQIAATLLAVAREHPDAYRLVWRHARHEPLFSAEAELFQLAADDFAKTIVAKHVSDPLIRQWTASSVVNYLQEGICAWLDIGDPGRDEEFGELLRAGTRALVSTSAN